MKIGEACRIFCNIEAAENPDEEKGMAIYKVCQMETHNSITKAQMLNVIRWLLRLCFELPEEEKQEVEP